MIEDFTKLLLSCYWRRHPDQKCILQAMYLVLRVLLTRLAGGIRALHSYLVFLVFNGQYVFFKFLGFWWYLIGMHIGMRFLDDCERLSLLSSKFKPHDWPSITPGLWCHCSHFVRSQYTPCDWLWTHVIRSEEVHRAAYAAPSAIFIAGRCQYSM